MESANYDPKNPYFHCNVKKVCAVCLRQLSSDAFALDKVINIEGSVNAEIKAFQVLEALSDFKLYDNGPQSICPTCFKNTVSVYKFQQLCNKTHTLFVKYCEYKEMLAVELSSVSHTDVDMDDGHQDVPTKLKKNSRRPPRRRIECEVCHKIIKCWSIKEHMRVHTGEKPHKCPHCDAAFAQWSTWNCHVRRHGNKKNCICSFCGKAFVDSCGLKKHEETHNEGRPYQCPLCDASFRTKGNLSSHRRVHMNETPFTCEYCAKSYPRRKSLTLHLRSHTGERPHVCAECGKGFTQMHSLRSHLQRHIRDNMEKAIKYTEDCQVANSDNYGSFDT